MKRGTLILQGILLLAAMFALAGGCAPKKEVMRPDNPAPVTVRVPLADDPAVRLHAEEPGAARPEPFSIADEYRDRWLRLIEIDVTPTEGVGPPAPEVSP